MVFARIFGARGLAAALLIGPGTGMMAGCATTQVTVQWSDPEFAGRSLRGEQVLVVCDAPDAAIRGACQDEVAAQVRASGAMPVISPDAGLTVVRFDDLSGRTPKPLAAFVNHGQHPESLDAYDGFLESLTLYDEELSGKGTNKRGI